VAGGEAKDSVLVIGRGPLADDVARALASPERRIAIVGIGAPRAASTAMRIDPSSAIASRELAAIVAETKPDTLVVLALSESARTPEQPWLSDPSIASMVTSALDRCLQHGSAVPALLLLSSTAVYGVAQGSPLVFDERHALPRQNVFESALARWAQGLRAAEKALVLWAVTNGQRVGVLRCASVFGGPMDSPLGAYVAARTAIRVLGFDPPCQVVHYDDLVRAIVLAVDARCAEVLNIVGNEVVPLSRLLALAGVLAIPVPGPLAGWMVTGTFDEAHLRWRNLADGSRATVLLGFRAERTIEECFGGQISR
jgi:nucleoside-diphosphate-sugar epimerase